MNTSPTLNKPSGSPRRRALHLGKPFASFHIHAPLPRQRGPKLWHFKAKRTSFLFISQLFASFPSPRTRSFTTFFHLSFPLRLQRKPSQRRGRGHARAPAHLRLLSTIPRSLSHGRRRSYTMSPSTIECSSQSVVSRTQMSISTSSSKIRGGLHFVGISPI